MRIVTLMKRLLQVVTPHPFCALTEVSGLRLPQRLLNRHSAFLYYSQRHYRDEQHTE